MDLKYSGIQSRHILQQHYKNTLQVPLLVYIPGEYPLLRASLARQLHGNFRVVTKLWEIEALSCAAVVVAASDGELMSTALMQYALAIDAGHDLAVADTSFGADGELFCSSHRAVTVAAMKKELFLRIAKVHHTPRELLQLAEKAAENRTHIPFALVRCPGFPETEALFAPGRKRALLLSHEFSMTGAPIVLVSIVPVLHSLGYDVAVLGKKWDHAASLFAQAGATVLTFPQKLEVPAMLSLAHSCDLVLANTVMESRSVQLLVDAPVPVIWWLHDSLSIYYAVFGCIPETLGGNVRICAVGRRAAEAMHVFRPDFSIGQLLYGLPDLAKEPRADRIFTKKNQMLFVNVGPVCRRKGQDILAKAIVMLSAEEREKAHFLFVGKLFDPETYSAIEELVQKYPGSVSNIPHLTREEIKALMNQCDCIVCSSRDDPMPTFVTEGAMFGKPAIISEHTGTAALIDHGKNGFVYRHNSPRALSRLLKRAIREPEKLAAMAPACRALYEENFTEEIFRKHVGEIVNSL